jgi:putative tricarboxylic transport membrane protein
MEMVEVFLTAVGELFTWPAMGYALLGTAIGLLFGALPGLGGATAIALLIPISYGWDPHDAFFLLGALPGGTSFGGAITAILVNTPGTSTNAASLLDGYPMTRQGRGAEAIGVAGTASTLGSLVGVVILLMLLPVSRQFILSFSYPEMFLITVLGLAMIALVTTGSMTKGLIAGCLGLFLSMIGRNPITGLPRFDFDSIYLQDGLPLVPVLIGLFAMAESIRLLAKTRGGIAPFDEELAEKGMGGGGRGGRWSGLMDGIIPTLKAPRLVTQSGIIGTVTGIIPAVGGSVAGFIAYAAAKQSVKDPEKFGHGDIRGLIAPEAANDAKDGGAVLPTVVFGLPGSPAWAVMLGALTIHGVTPGREMLEGRLDVTMIIIVALLFSSIVSTLLGFAIAPWAMSLVRLPSKFLAPGIFILALIGALASRQRPQDVLLVVVAGIIGYFLKKNGFSLIPIVIGLVLGETVEITLNQMLLVQGVSGLWTRPIALGILVIGGGGVVWAVWRNVRLNRREQEARRDARARASSSARSAPVPGEGDER